MALVPRATLREQLKRWYLFRTSHLVDLVALVALVPPAALKRQPKRRYLFRTSHIVDLMALILLVTLQGQLNGGIFPVRLICHTKDAVKGVRPV
ncbi:hypothetical protein F4775DRAFT_367140 [Biscogniauxia sp. FL1348]|nr:hypothetical protein F4775DRAFT_367140 [Biscogniauxia sp. FL1348]